MFSEEGWTDHFEKGEPVLQENKKENEKTVAFNGKRKKNQEALSFVTL